MIEYFNDTKSIIYQITYNIKRNETQVKIYMHYVVLNMLKNLIFQCKTLRKQSTSQDIPYIKLFYFIVLKNLKHSDSAIFLTLELKNLKNKVIR